MRAPLSLLLAAALVSPAVPVRAQPADPAARASWYEQKLQKDLDRDAAERFLKDLPLQKSLARDQPERLTALFRVAVDVKDFNDLLRSADDADTLRKALVIRLRQKPAYSDWPARSVFAGDPQKLLAWADQRANAQTMALLKEALWEWPTLEPAQRDWLAAHGAGEAAWRTLPFEDREKKFGERAKAGLPDLLAAFPRTRADLEALRLKKDDVLGALGEDDRQKLEDHFEKAEAAVDNLEKLSADPKVTGDPALMKALGEARGAGSLDETLARLDKLFDRIGDHNGELAALRPELPDEKIEGKLRDNLEQMLGPALLKEVAGTTPGAILRDFYKTHPLTIKIKDIGGDIALYHDETNEMWINDRYILRWLKSSCRTSTALMQQPAFGELAMLLATTFVHESFHGVQHAWAEEHDLPFTGGHNVEIESMEMEGIYLLEKRRSSPRYRKFIDAARKDSTLVDGDMRRAARLRRDPAAFRVGIARDNYPGWPSLEGAAQGDAASWDPLIAAMRAERARRNALPADQRRDLEIHGLDAMPDDPTEAQWHDALLKLKTPALEETLRSGLQEQAAAAQRYAAWRRRYEQANALTSRALARLRAQDQKK